MSNKESSMMKNLHKELPFLLKIITLLFILLLSVTSPRFLSSDKKEKKLTVIERVNIAAKSLSPARKHN